MKLYKNKHMNRFISKINKYIHIIYNNNMIRTPNFRNVNVNNQFHVKRLGFDAGMKLPKQSQIPELLKNRRIGKLDMDGLRPNFDAPSVKPRLSTDFSKLQEQEDAIFGKKVRLSDETLRKLFEVEVPDSTDVKWIAERQRLNGLGRPNVLPFGREQRKIKKQINLGKASTLAANANDVKEQFAVIQASIQQGVLENRRGRANIGANISQLILANNQLNILTRTELKQLINQTTQLTIPKDYRRAGFGHRLWSSSQIKGMKAEIVLFLLANLGQNPGIDPSTPIPQLVEAKFLENGVMTKGKTVDLAHLFTKMDTPEIPKSFKLSSIEKKNNIIEVRNSKYLDLKTFNIVPLSYALKLSLNGVDGQVLNGAKILNLPADAKDPWYVPLKVWSSKMYNNMVKTGFKNIADRTGIDWRNPKAPAIQVPSLSIPAAPAITAPPPVAPP
jgi:hypothetical protein